MRQDQKNRTPMTVKNITAVVCHIDSCTSFSGANVLSENDTAPAPSRTVRFIATTISMV